MKSSIITFLLVCFAILNAQSTTNPWDLNKLSEGQIIELEDIQFEMDATILSDDCKVALDKLKTFLISNKSVSIELQGHTSGTPPHKYCDALSSKRAEAVRDYLIGEGVSPNKLIAKGYGKRVPKASNLSAVGRKSNQRVDVKILSL